MSTEFDAILKATPGLAHTSIAKRMVDAVSNGQMSEYRFGLFQQEFCKALFPNDSLGIAMHKAMNTEAGRILWGPRPMVTTAQNSKLMKVEREDTYNKVPHIKPYGPDDGDDDDHSAANELERLVTAHRKANPHLSKDQCYQAVAQTDEGPALMMAANRAAVRKNV
jgi:hypothetical protein